MTRKLLILYGSDTGNAQDFAETLAYLCRYQSYDPTISSMDDFPTKGLLDYHALLVICSTAGQGEIPRNGHRFWKFLLRKRLPADLLSHIYFSTFGLGDSSYPRYNWAIRKIHARLLQLGAKEFCSRGESDEQSPEGPEAYFSAWSKVVFDKLPGLFAGGVEMSDMIIDRDTLLPSSFKIEIQRNKFRKKTDLDIKEIALDRKKEDGVKLDQFEVVSNERITSEDHFQDVRKLILVLKGAAERGKGCGGAEDCGAGEKKKFLTFTPGDTVALYPTNDAKDVEALIELQGWGEIADYPIRIGSSGVGGRYLDIPGGLVSKLTLRSLITHHLDIISVPRRSFFMQARHFAGDEREKEKLDEFTSLEESQELYDYANRPRRSILEVIQEFSSLKIPVDYILDVFPVIKPRLFSISSRSPRRDERQELELTIAIVEYKTIIRRLRRGLCTRWIKGLAAGDRIIGNLEYNKVKYGDNEEDPIVMACTGTGIAPVKSLIETEIDKKRPREIYLFTGNRYRDKDFLYGELWKKLDREGKIKLFATFSRDGEKGRHYISDRLYEEKKVVNEAIVKRGGVFYLCGSSGRMPIQVRISMEGVFSEENGWGDEESKGYLRKLEGERRYIQDTW
ncbi:DEKNAAC103279 [Brettanomyces naardenensis]|uniref:NADPH-dependent diflavin oxidoreductase 1 n=1 Tax=Brettanomyces naardenensis TaxID=13370 RepID=A0A448YMZ3_BRENA|nr:DEKNAAC103279 [Brettanomyces naardenensis]